MSQVSISLAGLPVWLRFAQRSLQEMAEARYQGLLLAGPAQPVLAVKVELVEDAAPLALPQRPPPPCGLEIFLEACGDHLSVASYDFRGEAELGCGEGHLRIAGEAAFNALQNYLRVVTAALALRHESLALHACGILEQGRGFVFFGPSGAGKSTIAQLSRPRTVLSDDLVVVRLGEGMVYGTPFFGEAGGWAAPWERAPVGGLFSLAKDERDYLEPLPGALAVAALAAAVPFLAGQPTFVGEVLRLCHKLAALCPVRRLHFGKSAAFWGLLP